MTGVGVVIFPFTWGSRIYGALEMLLLALATTWLVILAVRALTERGRAPIADFQN